MAETTPDTAGTGAPIASYPCVDLSVEKHVILIAPDQADLSRFVVRIDDLKCPHRHRSYEAAERCLLRWNDLEVERHR